MNLFTRKISAASAAGLSGTSVTGVDWVDGGRSLSSDCRPNNQFITTLSVSSRRRNPVAENGFPQDHDPGESSPRRTRSKYGWARSICPCNALTVWAMLSTA
jgi:hypothetical protein